MTEKTTWIVDVDGTIVVRGPDNWREAEETVKEKLGQSHITASAERVNVIDTESD